MPVEDWWARWLAIVGLFLTVAGGLWALYVYRRKQGRLKVRAEWEGEVNGDPTLHVRVTLKPVSDPVLVEKVAIHATRWWHWRDRGPHLTNTTMGRGLPETLQPTHFLVASVPRSIIWRAKGMPMLQGMTVKEALTGPLPKELRRFKVRAFAHRGDGRQFRSNRVEIVTRT